MLKIVLLVAFLFQLFMTLWAEHQGYFIEAIYEMMWMMFFAYLLEKQDD